MPNDLVTVATVATHMRLTTRRVTGMIKNGDLKATKYGRIWLVKLSDIKSAVRRPVGRPPIKNVRKPK